MSMLSHGLLKEDILDFGRTEVSCINPDDGLSALDIDTHFLDASALPATKGRYQDSGMRRCEWTVFTGS